MADNFNILDTPQNAILLKKDGVRQTLTTLLETVVFSYDIPAGMLTANSALKFMADQQRTAGGVQSIWRAKLGGTTLIQTALENTSTLIGTTVNRNSLSSQYSFAQTWSSGYVRNTTAVDTSLDQTFEITLDPNAVVAVDFEYAELFLVY